jgi:REP element-mobilizing transposase RayT
MPKRDYIEFQDRSVVKAYLITFRCYGNWLHGDERDSVDRRYYNVYGAPKIKPDAANEERKARQLKADPFALDARGRKVVETAIKEVCQIRNCVLVGINVRTNHVHVVVNGSGRPERMMDSFKAYSTRELRLAGLIGDDLKPWSRRGSTRYLWTEDHIASAVDYVVNGQGDELPTFD